MMKKNQMDRDMRFDLCVCARMYDEREYFFRTTYELIMLYLLRECVKM